MTTISVAHSAGRRRLRRNQSATIAKATFFHPGALPEPAAIRYAQFLKALHEPFLFESAGRERRGLSTSLAARQRPAGQPSFGDQAQRQRVVLPADDRRNRLHATDGPARKRNVLVLEIAHGFLSQDSRRRPVLECTRPNSEPAGHLPFELDSGRRAPRPVPGRRPLLTG